MFRFANPEYLFLLLALPVLVIGFVLSNIKKRKDIKKIGNRQLVKRLMPESSLKRSYLKFWFILGALFFGILAAARPQLGTSTTDQVTKKGIEMVIAMDVSNSMMANDNNSYPSRLYKAKQIMTQIINKSENDKIAIVVFAGDAYIQLPMTSDSQSAKLFLQNINTNLVPIQGTVIGKAVTLAMNSFSSNKNVSKSIVLITDGEGHDGDNGLHIVQEAAKEGIQVNVIGIGSPDGYPIPLADGSMMKDPQGNVVMSKLNEAMCKSLAQAGNGLYVRADKTDYAMRKLQEKLDTLKKTEIKGVNYSSSDEKFSYFAWIMLILLTIEICIFEKKNRLFRNIKLFK